MTLTDELKILNDKIKANQAQYDLDRGAAEVSVLSSKELDEYEYPTGEDLGFKPEVLEKVKFEYYPLDEALSSKVGNKTDKTVKIDKQDIFLNNSQYSFAKLKDISDFKIISFDF